MMKINLYIVLSGLSVALLSLLYFLLLTAGIPMIVMVPVIGVAVFFFVRFGSTISTYAKPFPKWPNIAAVTFLMLGLGLLIFKSHSFINKFGGWDAWAIWNLQARYLSNPDDWGKLFIIRKYSHPDYPLLFGGYTAFFTRIIGVAYLETISFVFSCSIMVFIPLLVYIENIKNNLVIAALAFVLFVTNELFLEIGVAMYADLTLAFFLLASIVCIKYYKDDKRWLTLAGACLGCCMWTKNEGVILAAIFVSVNFRALLFNGNFRYSLSGIALPLCTFILFKTVYSPPNNMVGGQNMQTLAQFVDWSRYKLIYSSLAMNMDTKFFYVGISVVVYSIVCFLERQLPDKHFIMLMVCMVAYFMVYVFSVEGLEWHLATSQDRLMLQLMPSVIYVVSDRISLFAQKRISGIKFLQSP
jgi:hypothetical protein